MSGVPGQLAGGRPEVSQRVLDGVDWGAEHAGEGKSWSRLLVSGSEKRRGSRRSEERPGSARRSNGSTLCSLPAWLLAAALCSLSARVAARSAARVRSSNACVSRPDTQTKTSGVVAATFCLFGLPQRLHDACARHNQRRIQRRRAGRRASMQPAR